MANEPVSPPIQTKYAEQLAADLAANHAEQANLKARMNQLHEEEKWLASTLESMPTVEGTETASPAARRSLSSVDAAARPDDTAVPQPRAEKTDNNAAAVATETARKTTASKRAAKKAPAKTAPAKRTAKKTTPGKQNTAAKGAEPAHVTAKKTVKSQGPTLGQLLKGLLSQQPGEPKKVSEVRAELEAAHPERVTSEQVVRNALTKLVAQDGLEKDSRQGVVLYTWPAAETAPDAVAQAGAGDPVEQALAKV